MWLQSILEKFWYSHGPWLLLLRPLSFIFHLIVQVKRILYQIGFLNSNQFKKSLLVVGNINVGGTGKTPFIAHLVKLLESNAIRVGIVSRGYMSQQQKFPYQVRESDTAKHVGDEAFMQFRQLKVPLVIDPDRSRAVKYLLENNSVDLVISDDGLQHYAMTRDIEVVLIDGERQLGNQLILPFGPLREPISRLASVDFIIQNGEQTSQLTSNKFTMKAVCFVQVKSNKEFSLNHFANKRVEAIAAIGNPQRFFNLLQQFCEINTTRTMPDHHPFSSSDFTNYSEQLVMMTEKDAVKCLPFAKDNWYYLKVNLELDKTLEEALLNRIKQTLVRH